MGVDYGLRRIGIATSVGISPRPLPTIMNNSNPPRAATLVAERAQETLSFNILVGLPVDMRGTEGDQAEATRAFVKELVNKAPWAKIMLLDERLTTFEAKERLAEMGLRREDMRGVIDSASAVVLLERYFASGDDYQAVVVHEPAEDGYGVEGGKVGNDAGECIGFSEWRKQAMERAAAHNPSQRRRKR